MIRREWLVVATVAGWLLLAATAISVAWGAEVEPCPHDYAQPGAYAVVADTITVEGIEVRRTRPSPMPTWAPWVLYSHALGSLPVFETGIQSHLASWGAEVWAPTYSWAFPGGPGAIRGVVAGAALAPTFLAAADAIRPLGVVLTAGYSAGGAAALLAARYVADSRVEGTVALAPPAMVPEPVGPLAREIMLVAAKRDAFAPPSRYQSPLWREVSRRSLLDWLVTVKDGSHGGFSDLFVGATTNPDIALCGLPNPVTAEDIAWIANEIGVPETDLRRYPVPCSRRISERFLPVADQLGIGQAYAAAFVDLVRGNVPAARCWLDGRPFRDARAKKR